MVTGQEAGLYSLLRPPTSTFTSQSISAELHCRPKCPFMQASSIPCTRLTMAALLFPLERVQPLTLLLHRRSHLLTTGFVLCFIIPHAISNYHAYPAMEPGGLPYNVFGWLCALSRKPFARETLSPEQYDQDGNKESFLGSINERRGDRPKLSWRVFPSRQPDRYAPPEMSRVRATCDPLGSITNVSPS